MVKDALALAETASKVIKENQNILLTIFPALESKRLSLEAYRQGVLDSNLSSEAKAIALATSHTDLMHKINQSKIAKLAVENARDGTNFTSNVGVDIAFLDKFMDEAKFVYDEEIQLMWAKVLAGEFEAPNSTSFNVVRILSEITKGQAELFANICSLSMNFVLETDQGFSPNVEAKVMLFFDSESNFLQQIGIDFQSLSDLESLGLIKFDALAGFIMKFDSSVYRKIHLYYNNKTTTVTKFPDKAFPIGNVMLTTSGEILKRSVCQENIPAYNEHIGSEITKQSVEISENAEVLIRQNGDFGYSISKLANAENITRNTAPQ